RPGGSPVAFSLSCTHLGCRVHWQPKPRTFLCPCHMGIFDERGQVVSGPPPSALPQYQVSVGNENVFVHLPEGLAMSAGAWLKERVAVSLEALKAAGNEPVPGHLKVWWFALGGTAAMLFFGQIATGLLLCVYYQPTPERAWESVRYITGEVPFGWWIRSLHKWGANLMIVAVSLHLMRVFFTGAYRKPREANWMVGVTLFLLTLMLGFTGYSIVYEQLSYWGATVAANITEAVPLIGPGLARTLRGGEQIGAPTLSRFFILHAAILPSVLLLLFSLHVALIRIHGVTE